MDSTCVASLCTAPVNHLCQQTESVMSSGLMRSTGGKVGEGRVKVVDSMSCRQLYLRSYKFSREEDYKDTTRVSQRMKKYLNKAKILVHGGSRSPPMEDRINRRGSGVGPRTIKKKVERLSFAAFVSTFHRLLACTVRVGVVDRQRGCTD